MSTDFSNAIRQIVNDRGISEDLVYKTIEDVLLAAYKRKFGTVENAVIKFSEDGEEVSIFAKKKIVEDVYDPVSEIYLDEALEYNQNCEIGDELLIEINPRTFDRVAIQSAKQRAKQNLREIQKDTLYSEFEDKVGEMIIGYYQRERNGNIYVDLGKAEAILPKRYQSPREVYTTGDRIKALIYEVNKSSSGLQIILSRTHADFVKKIFELEVPEVYDKTVEVYKIVRQPGYRTKIAVYSNRDDVDPVGACVGLKGVRIQAIVRELEGEKVDILKYDPDPKDFIKNALSPAQVSNVVVLDEGKRQALAVVADNMLSLAIGKQGLNVRLANRLVDWNIDVKTEAQFMEMDITVDSKRAVSALFGDDESGDDEEISRIDELPDVEERIVEILSENGIELIEDLVSMDLDNLKDYEGIGESDIEKLKAVIDENVEIVDEEVKDEYASEEDNESEIDEEYQDEDETEDQVDDEENEVENEDDELGAYECPECGAEITEDMNVCPACGVGLSFEEEIEDEESEE